MFDLMDKLQKFWTFLCGSGIEVVLEFLLALLNELGVFVAEHLLGWEALRAQLKTEVLEFGILAPEFVGLDDVFPKNSEAFQQNDFVLDAVLDLVRSELEAVVGEDSPSSGRTNAYIGLAVFFCSFGGFFDF